MSKKQRIPASLLVQLVTLLTRKLIHAIVQRALRESTVVKIRPQRRLRDFSYVTQQIKMLLRSKNMHFVSTVNACRRNALKKNLLFKKL